MPAERILRGILAKRGQKVEIHADGKLEVTGSVGDFAKLEDEVHKGDWNEYVIIAKGNHILQFVNGLPTVDLTDEQEVKAAKTGILALQLHAGPPMKAQFKNIRLKKLD